MITISTTTFSGPFGPKTWALLALTALLPACGGSEQRQLVAPEQAVLMENQAKWQLKAPEDFSYTLSRSCFCMPEGPWRIVYASGEFHHRLNLNPDAPEVDSAEIPETVAQLFTLLERAYNDQAAEVRVQYHPDYGLPTSIAIDWIPAAADDEMAFEVSDFTLGFSEL